MAGWEARWENYGGNNPNKYQTDIRHARHKVQLIEDSLKASGVLPRSPQEELERELDAAYPNAASKQIVTHNGVRYQRKFWPMEKSRSGKTVTAWGKGWEKLPE